MNKVQYKGYEIHATPQQLRDSGNWNIHLTITKFRGPGVTEKMFTAANTFKTQQEAIEHCINFGKQIIDGNSPTCTVSDL